MAGLLLSMASEEENRPDIRIETVPGVTAKQLLGRQYLVHR